MAVEGVEILKPSESFTVFVGYQVYLPLTTRNQSQGVAVPRKRYWNVMNCKSHQVRIR